MINRLNDYNTTNIPVLNNYVVSAMMHKQVTNGPDSHVLLMNKFQAISPEEAIGIAIGRWESICPGYGYFVRPIVMSV